ncbi:MAG: RING finger protein [Candidatus Babeliales bacterium]
MENVGVVGLLCCIVISLSAMQETQNLRDMAASHGRSLGQEQKKPAEEDIEKCPICLQKLLSKKKIIHTQCTEVHHKFHKSCVLPWFAKKEQCPICREPLKPAIKKILEKEKEKIIEKRKRMRRAEEALNPELWQARERREFWAKFAHFTALGLGIATLALAPGVIKEYFAGPGAGRPVFAEAAQIIIPTTVTLALPLEQQARRLEQEEELD